MVHLTRKEGISLVKLLIIGMVVQLFVIGYVFYQSYAGRSGVVTAQRKGCERGKHDRDANAQGWRIAETARRASGDIAVANHYAEIASGLEARSRIKCADVFPLAGLLP